MVALLKCLSVLILIGAVANGFISGSLITAVLDGLIAFGILYGFSMMIDFWADIGERISTLTKEAQEIRKQISEKSSTLEKTEEIKVTAKPKVQPMKQLEPVSEDIIRLDRSGKHITCPYCGKVQKSDRYVCWACGSKLG